MELRRRLGLADAITIGAGSMIGAGVFTAWAPAADAAGRALLIGLVIAAAVAFCNATSSAQLAALHPESGGTYVYARYRLGPAWGHLAAGDSWSARPPRAPQWRSRSAPTLWPAHQRLAAVVAVLLITVVNLGGLERTAFVTRWLLACSLLALAAVVVAGWSSDGTTLHHLAPLDAGLPDILRSAGFLFFAFAGYARIATLGEEVVDPRVTIPKAITRALTFVLVVYAIVGITVVASTPIDVLAASDAPSKAVVDGSPMDVLAPVVAIGAAIASLGVLLNLIPGVARTALAMARRNQLPAPLAHVDRRRSHPRARRAGGRRGGARAGGRGRAALGDRALRRGRADVLRDQRTRRRSPCRPTNVAGRAGSASRARSGASRWPCSSPWMSCSSAQRVLLLGVVVRRLAL